MGGSFGTPVRILAETTHNQVLFSAHEIGPGQRLDPQPIDGTGVEQPGEVGQGHARGEAGIADAVGDAPLTALVGLLADEPHKNSRCDIPWLSGPVSTASSGSGFRAKRSDSKSSRICWRNTPRVGVVGRGGRLGMGGRLLVTEGLVSRLGSG